MKRHARIEAAALRSTGRWSPYRALLSLVVITATACGHGGRSSPSDAAPTTVLGPHTHVVRPELLTAVTVEGDQLVFAQSDVAGERWQPGDILVGDFAAGSTRNPGGFLRRVISIEVMGDRAIIHTEQAALTDAIASGDIEQSFAFEPELEATPRRDGVGQLAAGGTLAIGPFGEHSLEIELEKTGDPDIKATGKFGIENLSASLGLELDFGLHISGFSVTSAHAIVSGDVSAELAPFAELGMELVSKTDIRSRLDFRDWLTDPSLRTTPFKIEFPDLKTKPRTIFIGEVPVVIRGIVKSSVACTVNLSTKLEATADISFRGTARAGFTYAGGVGMGILDGSATGTVTPTYQPSAGGSFECEVLIQFGVEFFESIEGLLGIKPYAKAEATLQPRCLGTNFVPNPQGADELTYGVNATFSVEVSNLLKFLGLDFKISLPDLPLGTPGKITLGELGPPVGGDHCPCGAVDEPCCDTTVVNGQPCDPGLTCSPSNLCEGTPIFDAGPDGSPDVPPPPPPGTVGTTRGDPHLMTFDRVRYDAQSVGELILAHDTVDGTMVQVRTRPLTSRVAVNAAVAASVGTDVVAFYADRTVRINHVVTVVPQGRTTLNGGSLHHTGDGYAIVWPDNSQLYATPNGSFVGNIRFYVGDDRQSRMEGLLGNFDGSPTNEIVTRAGVALAAPISFADFYHTYLESWRISQAESLFDYRPGETTETFTDRSFPPAPATTRSLSDADRASASAICQAAGVAADWFDACVLDVALSGSADFAGELAGAPPSDTSIDTIGGDVTPPVGGGVPPGTCVATGSMLAPRLGFEARAVTLSNGKVLVAGGLDTSTGHVLAEAEIYDPATGTFSPAGSMSKPRIRFALVTLGNGKVLAAGGINDAGTVEASADIYDPVQNAWTPTASMATARVDVGGAMLPDGHALVVAGAGQGALNRSTGVVTLAGALKSAEVYAPRSGTFAATGDTAVAGTTMFAVARRLDGNVFAATGSTGEVYTVATGHFTAIGALPTTIDGAGVFAFTLASGAVFAQPALGLADALAGASVGAPVLVDPITNRSTALPNGTIGGTSAAILLATGDVFLAGGQHTGTATAATQVYQVASAAWQTPGAMTVVRHGPVLANLPDGAVLIMGGCQTNACGAMVLNTAEICNPLSPSPPPPPARSRPSPRGRALKIAPDRGSTVTKPSPQSSARPGSSPAPPQHQRQHRRRGERGQHRDRRNARPRDAQRSSNQRRGHRARRSRRPARRWDAIDAPGPGLRAAASPARRARGAAAHRDDPGPGGDVGPRALPRSFVPQWFSRTGTVRVPGAGR